LLFSQATVQRATDGAVIYVPNMTSATPSSNNVLIYNGTAWVPSAPSALSVLTNYWAQDGGTFNLTYGLGTHVTYNSTASLPTLGIAGANYVALRSWNNRTLTNGLSQSQIVLTNGTSRVHPNNNSADVHRHTPSTPLAGSRLNYQVPFSDRT